MSDDERNPANYVCKHCDSSLAGAWLAQFASATWLRAALSLHETGCAEPANHFATLTETEK